MNAVLTLKNETMHARIEERNGGDIDAVRTPSIPILKYYAILMEFKTIDSTVCGFASAIEKPLSETIATGVGAFCSTKRWFFLIMTEKR